MMARSCAGQEGEGRDRVAAGCTESLSLVLLVPKLSPIASPSAGCSGRWLGSGCPQLSSNLSEKPLFSGKRQLIKACSMRAVHL